MNQLSEHSFKISIKIYKQIKQKIKSPSKPRTEI